MDYCLKFESEEQANAVLFTKSRPSGYEYVEKEVDVWLYQTAYGESVQPVEYSTEECELFGYTFLRKDKQTQLVDPNPEVGDWVLTPNYRNIDTIGVIYKPTGEMLQGEDGEYPAMAPVEGWHVNTRGEKHPDLLAYAVEVNTPIRVWA